VPQPPEPTRASESADQRPSNAISEFEASLAAALDDATSQSSDAIATPEPQNPRRRPAPTSYTGIISTLLSPAPSAEVVGQVWTAIEHLVGIGKVTSSAPAKDQEGFELMLDLEDDELSVNALTPSLPGLPVEAVGQRRIVIRSPKN
jgi:hypothetical protein